MYFIDIFIICCCLSKNPLALQRYCLPQSLPLKASPKSDAKEH